VQAGGKYLLQLLLEQILLKEEQTTQWPKEKLQKNKQLSTKHTYTT
jgi:hypothetical protein